MHNNLVFYLRRVARPLAFTAWAACAPLVFVPLFGAAGAAHAQDAAADASAPDPGIPERRKPQFAKEFGYALFPYPYSLPGIGSGLSLVGGALNVADTYTDVYGIVFSGGVRGSSFGVADIHLVPRTLILDVGFGEVSRVTVQSYAQRGMHSDKNDYRLLELADTAYQGARLTATFFDRRFEMYSAYYQGASRLNSIRDRDGQVIVATQDSPRDYGHTTIFGARADLTDDYADPRRGVRADLTRSQAPTRGSGAAYYVVDANATAYIPFGRRNTWAFNVLRSEAVVTHQGETDPARLQQQLGLDCTAIADPQQRAFCTQVIDSMIAQNTYGTATGLGGFNRLRGYPQGRFQGAHTLFFGTEFRWNLTEEHTPFDIFVMKDVRTVVQLAFFYETGVTSDRREDLWQRANMRDAYGVGFRIVTASGVVFRGDVGYGREGVGLAVFIGYPWEI